MLFAPDALLQFTHEGRQVATFHITAHRLTLEQLSGQQQESEPHQVV